MSFCLYNFSLSLERKSQQVHLDRAGAKNHQEMSRRRADNMNHRFLHVKLRGEFKLNKNNNSHTFPYKILLIE